VNIHFKETLQRIEIAAGIKTMTELAKVVGTSQQYVSKKSKEGEFPINWAYEVAKKFNISTDWIMTGEGPTRKNEATEINPLLVEVNEWLNEGRKHENAEFKILFEQQMIRAFFDYEEWKRKRDFKESGKSKFPASKVA
jgi:hypothetical protein